jgi:arylsulfatase A-like enzyme
MHPHRLLIGLLFIVVSLVPTARGAADKPNIVFILIDDLGRNDLGCYGSTYFRTPRIDRLAKEGVRFTDAYAACPVCSPTRASIMTGKYPARLHLTDWLPGRKDRPDQKLLRPIIRQQLPLEEITLAEALKSAGYATGHVGKWHLGGVGFEPQRQGFDVNIGGNQAGSPVSYFAPYRAKDGRSIPGLEQAPAGEYLTDRLTSEAEKFIEQHRDRPFFLYLAHYAVHIPLKAKPDLVAKYPASDKKGVQNNPIYAAMIESMDDSVGRIRKKLDDLGLSERTIVFFMSDNGGLCTREGPNTPATINSPLREGKGYLYEGGIRAPLLIHWPGVTRAGRVETAPVSSIDFFPTILEMCGVKPSAPVDGVSLASLLRGGAAPARDALYWHYPHYSNQGGRPGGAIRAGDFKLIEFYEQNRRELYDVKHDPGERRNLSEQRSDLVKELAAKLDRWRTEVGAQRMSPNPDYVPNPQAADGSITLPAKTADIHGVQLRYEPLPHKNTLGFWTRAEDWVSWDFDVKKPGTFSIELLQGCGQGQGGSQVEVSVAEQTFPLTVEDTGHFQNFRPHTVGQVKLAQPGRYTLSVKPRSKRARAVMDLRAVTLWPVGK